MRYLILIFISFYSLPVNAANLIEVYQQALSFDPTFQKAVAEQLSIKEGVPISLSSILPNVALTANPSVMRASNSGINYVSPFLYPRNYTSRTYTLNLAITQTVFNFADFFNLSSSVFKSKSADATINAALQDLMIRVSNAYFTVLKDQENLYYSEESKKAYEKQLKQVNEQFKSKIRTITDVDTAKASYDFAVSNYYGALNTLENDREALREITGIYYNRLDSLNKKFPIINPQPQNVDEWIKVALKQNWSIKSSQYKVQAARQTVRQQMSGHLPTVSVQGNVTKQYTNNINLYPSVNNLPGTGVTSDREIGLNINFPIYLGGQVTALTNQAQYDYQAAQQALMQTNQAVLTKARQSYNSIVNSIFRIKADTLAVQANERAVYGMEVTFKVGIQSLIDVLNQQQKLYQSQIQYASDRYEYVKNVLALKQAAGTLSINDLQAINGWLTV